jgi:hypothetical protein
MALRPASLPQGDADMLRLPCNRTKLMSLPPLPPVTWRPNGDVPRPGASITAERKAALQFEAFVLQSFIEAMLPRHADSVFGSGTAGTLWKSMFAEKLAMELASSAGLGIADMVAPDRLRAAGGHRDIDRSHHSSP